ncbi:mucin-2 isoform X2 [Acyrthosiphon pisum]|uniref:Uncharacterized protein n=1 Tax=Acyrthosiphon pisum TaxID=7029 RepID=A0A8R2A4Z5_ACYPI|nr:mucin-2 isoform X2 [Acyrthosiphon pisum]|eukprot:XP_001944065.2 PREDICTED: mucin-2-like isoform X2 [Acyrthosiphon pisum]
MKMPTASNMCTLSCALIICTLVTTARTTNTNNDDSNEKTREPFDGRETTTEESYDDWIELPSTTPIANGKYGSKPSLSTPPVPDLNDSPYPDEFVTDNSIDSSTKPGNDYIPSDKKNSYTTEPIPTTNGTQLLAEPPTRTQPLTTTPIANGRYSSTTTSSTPSGTNLNDKMQDDEANVSLPYDVIDNSQTPENNKYSSTEPSQTNDHTQITLKEPPTRMTSTARTTTTDDPNVTKSDSTDDDTFEDWTSVQLPSTTFTAILKDESTTTPGTPSVTDLDVEPQQDVIGNSTSQAEPKSGYNVSHKKHNSTKSIPENDDTRSRPKKRKTKWSNWTPFPFIWITTTRPTSYYGTTEWIKPTTNCKCAFNKQHSRRCKKNEKETTTTKVWGRLAEYERLDQQRHMSETTTDNVQGQLEKWKIQQKVLEMESTRLNTILDILNSH